MAKKIKAVKIDVIKKQVYEILIEDSLPGYYEALECDQIEKVAVSEHHDLIIDEEGRINEADKRIGEFGWISDGSIHVFAGHGLIVGHDGHGNWISHRVNIPQLEKFILFP